MLKNSPNHYGLLTKVFHFGIGFSIIYLLYLGYTMTGMEKSQEKFALYAEHKQIGILVLVASVLFYIWRIFNVKPDDIPTTIKGQKFLSKLVKYSLLIIMFLYPLTGYVMSSAGGHPIKVFDHEIPLLIEKGSTLFNIEIGSIAHTVHGYLFYITLGLLALHVFGALYHQFIIKDETLKRMTTKFKND